MQVTLEDLLKAGVHFGHQVKRWHPQMKGYIYTKRNGVHIIDLVQTMTAMEKAASFIEEKIASGKNIIFVGTKRQARKIIKDEAIRCGAMYINNRWPGGLISNYRSVKNTIERYNEMVGKRVRGELEKMTKKQKSVSNKELERKEKLVGGINLLKEKPELLFVLDVKREAIAVKEAHQANIPVIAICDTNSNPNRVTYPIPGNDDALKSIQLFVSFIADAVEKGKKQRSTKPEARSQEVETKKIVKPKVETQKTQKEIRRTVEDKPQKKTEAKELKIKDINIEELGLTASMTEKLKEAGVKTLVQLKARKDSELVEIKGLGEKAIEKIRQQVKEYEKKNIPE